MSVTFCESFEKLLHFYLLPGLKQVFSVTIFRLLPSPINFFIYRFTEYLKFIKYPANEYFISIKIA